MERAAQSTAEQHAHMQPDLLLASFQAVAEGLMVVENDRIVLANPAAAQLLGYGDQNDLIGEPATRFFAHGLFCRDLLQNPPTSRCAHPACEWNVRRDDGRQMRVAVRCTGFREGKRALILAAFHETRRAELGQALRSDDRRFRAIFEGAAIGIVTASLDARIIESNPAFSKMLGYSAQELVGKHAGDFHPGDFQQDEMLLKELMRGERDSFELEKRFRRKDGAYNWGHLVVSLVRDHSSRPAFVIAMLEDTTERKRAEEQLREAEKLEVIGRLAGGIAHDFNNLLTGILLYCDLVLTGIGPGSRMRQHIEEIRMAGEQGAALTQQLLSMARKQAPQPRLVLLNEVVSSTENLLRRLIGEHIEMTTILEPRAGTVLADIGQLRQVLLNLVLNARDAMPHGGEITVSTSQKALPGSGAAGVSLLVRDTGCGMDEETKAHLFEPFFTTKQEGQGTGLGLATVQRIIKEAGGEIAIESEPGRGTQVEIFLPLAENTQASLPTARPALAETILLVDDHASARKSMHRVLQHAGYEVLEAGSGKRALAIFNTHLKNVDLLVADWTMPGMTGRELAQALRNRKPSLKVLLISGYQGGKERLDASLPLIRKPFSGSALLERIREVLDSKGDLPC